MPRLVCPRASGASMRPMAIAALAAAALTTIVSMWAADRAAFADTNRIEINAATTVGAMSGDVMSPAVRIDPPQPADRSCPRSSCPPHHHHHGARSGPCRQRVGMSNRPGGSCDDDDDPGHLLLVPRVRRRAEDAQCGRRHNDHRRRDPFGAGRSSRWLRRVLARRAPHFPRRCVRCRPRSRRRGAHHPLGRHVHRDLSGGRPPVCLHQERPCDRCQRQRHRCGHVGFDHPTGPRRKRRCRGCCCRPATARTIAG